MKKFYTLLVSVMVCAAVSAQPSYYVLPSLNVGFNPGNLNGDAEQPAEPGWNEIMSTTATAQWSPSQTIPFNFQFNGSAVSNFVVSSTGVLTFNSSPGTPPSDANQTLPSTAIPNNSICAWGLNLSGGNDNVRTKVFGTSPNRQLWIQWTSATAPELTGAGRWAYWSIVLEEGSNKIYVVDQRTSDFNQNSNGQAVNTGNNVSLTVGIQISSTDYASAPSSPSTGSTTLSTSPNGDDASDNSFYEFVYGSQKTNDLSGNEADMANIVETNKGVYISGIFRNLGQSTVNTADFNYRVNGGSTVTASSVGNLPVATGEFKALSSPTQWTPSTDGKHEIEMWMSNLNGNADQDNSNDTIKVTVYSTSDVPERKVVIEERTGTWCQYCPRGMVAMQIMATQYHESTVLIAVHNADPMALNNYDPNLSGGFPTFTGGRVFTEIGISGDASNMINFHDQRMETVPSASVEITDLNYNSGNGSISADVESEFLIDAPNSDYRFVMVLTEDGVIGSTPGYAQVNWYSGQNTTLVDLRGYDYVAAPNPVPASDMIYDHVAIDIAPSFNGSPGVVPANISFGQKVNHTLTTTTPGSMQNENHVYAHVLLLDMNKGGEVVNATSKKLTNVVALDETDLVKASVYPNPAVDFFTVQLEESADFQLELINSTGQVVYRGSFSDSKEAVVPTSDYAKGMYLLNISSGDKVSTMSVAITR